MRFKMKRPTARGLCKRLPSVAVALLLGSLLPHATHAAQAAAPTSTPRPLQTNHFAPYALQRNDLGRSDHDQFITRAQAAQDLDTLAQAITDNSSYILSSTFDHRAAIAQIKAALPARVSVNGLSTQLNKLVRLFGDDHAQVDDWNTRIPQLGMGLQIGRADTRYFLYRETPAGLFDADYPYVRAIDGVAIEEWARVMGNIGQGPLSSPAARFSRGYRLFPYTQYLRREMRLPERTEAVLEMVSEDGLRVVTRRVKVNTAVAAMAGKPFQLPDRSRMLAGNIGYLRVPAHRGELADRLVTELPALMAQFRNTDALIVDARQGGGGQRKVLNALFPYFMRADAKPYVFNVVKLRKHAVQSDPAKMFDDPDKRFWYIPDPNVPADEMLAYRQLLKGFIPAWNPPASEFTDWYFTTLKPAPDKPYYGKPVYLLIDWGLGSAGDIFTSAFKGYPGITLVGTATMGRSGQGVLFALPNSKLEVNISTMASFQKTGERYDTVGIQPDIPMEPIPSDWYGASDSVLARVQALIDARKSQMASP